jgi:protein SCO1
MILLLLSLQNPAAGVEIDQRLGERVSLDLPFRDEAGREVRLGEFFGRRPVILAFVYFRCPSLCGQVLGGLHGAFKTLPEEDYEFVAVSLDPREAPGRRKEKGHYLTI